MGAGDAAVGEAVERLVAAAEHEVGAGLEGVDAAGVIAQLGATSAQTAELGVHPGEHADADLHRYEWGYRWGDELDALVAPEAREAVRKAGFTLGSFAALATAPS